MHHLYSPSFQKLIQQIRRLYSKLQRLGETASLYQQHKLQRRYERCLQKLAALSGPAFKMGAAFGVASVLSLSASAQSHSCDTFRLATYSNPIAPFKQTYPTLGKPYFVDIDNDGDLDCYAEYNDDGGNHPGHVLFLRNTGTKEIPYFAIDTASGLPSNLSFGLGIFPGNTDGPKLIDMDGDGDYDCLLGAYTSDGVIRYFENTGNATTPVFTERTGADNPFKFVYGYYGLSFSLADLDSDGDFELVTSVSYHQRFYKNVGTKQKPSFKLYETHYDVIGYPFTFYDWNKDGLVDEFTDGNWYYQNTGTAKKPVFTHSGGGPTLPSSGFSDIMQFVDLNNDGFVEMPDEFGNLVTTAPDAFIKYDSTQSNALHAYPRNGGYTYRWQRNGKNIAGATGSNYTPNKPGTYSVQVIGTCGTGVSIPVKVNRILNAWNNDSNNFITTSPVKSLLGTAVTAYPNPFTASFVMQLNSNVELSKTSIRITDIAGRIVQTIKPTSYTVHLGEGLSKGVFIVQVMKDKSVVYEGKVVKE